MSSPDDTKCYAVPANVYPGTFVTVRPCLEGDINGRGNFRIWEEQMLCLLDSQDVSGFVNGDVEPPLKEESEQLYKEWWRRDRLVKGWILGSIGKDALDAVWDQPTARSTWLELHRFFETRDPKHELVNEHQHMNELENKNEHGNDLEYKNEDELENKNEHENELEYNNENENENEDEHENELEYKNEDELENKNEHENELEYKNENEDELENKNEHQSTGDVDYSRYLPLYKAAQTGDWDTAKNIFNNNIEQSTAIITSDSETALHVAVLAGRANGRFVRRLVELMPEEALAIKDSFGKTALHNAAIVGNITAACALLEKNPHLLYILSDGINRLPVLEAAMNCQKDTLKHLISMHEANKEYTSMHEASATSIFEGRLGIQLLNEIIASQYVDIALDLVHKYPNLILLNEDEEDEGVIRFLKIGGDNDSTSALSSVIAATYTLFQRTESSWQRFIYDCIPLERPQLEAPPLAGDIENLSGDGAAHKNYLASFSRGKLLSIKQKLGSMIWNVVKHIVPKAKELQVKKARHHQAHQFAQYLCNEVSKLPEREALQIFKDSILVAARHDAREIAEMIIDKKPSVIYHTEPWTGRNIFHMAASLRYENFFNLIYSMSDRKYMFFNSIDDDRNNLMHLCGRLAPPESLDRVTGPALQLQREIQWFKEMEKFVNPSRRTWANKHRQTPQMLFSEEHDRLRADGEKWMKDTSNSCTIAATLIATVMFASAFTAPGGLESATGVPLFAGQTAFSIFAIADTISLFTSICSLLTFLSIVTSRYSEEDFLYLTKTLSIGMLCLFISIMFMLVAFSVAVYMVLYAKMTWFVIVLAAVAVLPATSFVLVLFPLLIDVVSSSYGPGIFGKRSNRVIY